MSRSLLLAVTAGLLAASSALAANPIVVLDTSMGPIKIELFEDKAPVTVKNFLDYADAKFYDGTIFHRVIPSFMIQGGGFEPGMKEKTTRAPIKNESDNGLSNDRGTIAMARTPDPQSATAQFFINVRDNKALDRAQSRDRFGYCVFGKVIEGMDIVDKIKGVPTGTKIVSVKGQQVPFEDVPLKDVVIESIRREK